MRTTRPILSLLTVAALAGGGLTTASVAEAGATNDTIWTVDRTPIPRDNNPTYPDTLTFRATTALSPTDAWAVGQKVFFKNGHDHFRTLAEHWDGKRWSIVPTPAAAPLASTDEFTFSAIDAVSSDDIWAVVRQDDSFTNAKAVFSEHWDGTRWTIVPFPAIPIDSRPFADAVTAISANDVWVAGSYGPRSDPACTRQLLEHWDGRKWTQMPNPDVPFNCLLFPSAISGSSSSDIWITGTDADVTVGDGQAFAEHYDGNSWTAFPVVDPAFNGNHLTGLAVLSPTNAWAVGDYYNAPSAFDDRTLIEHWDGRKWSVVPSPDANPETYLADRFFSVTALSATDLWAVGWSDNAPTGLAKPLIEHWNGTEWAIVKSPIPGRNYGSPAIDVSSAAPGNVFVIGPYSPAPRGVIHTPAVLHTTKG